MTFERLQLTRKQKDKFRKIRRLEQLQKLDPVEFEQFCGYLYERRGYKAHMTATSGDEGVDLLLRRGNRKEVVQCKRYQGSVGQPVVRDMYGTMLHTKSAAAAIVTTGRFTRAAETWAVDKPIELVDGHELMSWVNRERRGGGNSWIANNARPITMVALVMLALSIGLFVLGEGIETLRARTETPALVLPTIGVTVVSEQSVEPTVIAEPTVAVSEVDSAEITIPTLPNHALTTDPTVWNPIPAIALTHIIEQSDAWDGTRDVEVTFKLAYDANNLYGYVTVEDDTHVQTNRAQTAYFGDSVELEIDTLGDRSTDAQPDDYQYVISPGDFGEISAEAFRFRGNGSVMTDDWGTNATVLTEQTATGYVLAFQIPWFDMRLNRNPAIGTTYGLALNVNDNDTPNTSQQEVMLSNTPNRRWSKPGTWGSLTLGD